jgi:AFG3 family protein
MAVERIIGGVEQKRMVSSEQRKTVAVHESGHAVVSWFLEGGMPLLKLTIIPRSKGALGFAQYLPNESSLQTKEELLDQICSILGGRVAEKVFFGRVTTGAYDDLQKVYNIAHSFVTKVGFSDEIGYVNHAEHENGTKRYSNETNRVILYDSAHRY